MENLLEFEDFLNEKIEEIKVGDTVQVKKGPDKGRIRRVDKIRDDKNFKNEDIKIATVIIAKHSEEYNIKDLKKK